MLKSLNIYLARKRLKAGEPQKSGSRAEKYKGLVLLYDHSGEGILKYTGRLKEELGIPEENFYQVFCNNGVSTREEAVGFQWKDITLGGRIKNPDLKEIITSGPNLVLSYTEKHNPKALFLREVISAPISAGRFEEKAVNLSIYDGNNPAVFTEELIKYLKILKEDK
ncbi:DUF6913 domain-containing protein [Salegentibacter sp. F14]